MNKTKFCITTGHGINIHHNAPAGSDKYLVWENGKMTEMTREEFEEWRLNKLRKKRREDAVKETKTFIRDWFKIFIPVLGFFLFCYFVF